MANFDLRLPNTHKHIVMKNLLLAALSTGFAYLSYAQEKNASVAGRVLNNEKQPVVSASVQLLRASDSSLVKTALSNASGKFEIGGFLPGNYFLSVSAVGFSTGFSEKTVFKAGENTVSPISLSPTAATLGNVTVVGKRPLIENKIDKTVVNVDASITNAGTTAMDVLEKSPGIMVDKDGNISLKGKQGVMVMIDNKPTYLGAQDLANMLRNMSANQLDQVEIMTQPSARYDASGNSGIINIKTKKNKQKGFNGNFTTSYIQGVQPKNTNSLQANYRTGKLNIFGNYGFNYWEGFNELELNRTFRTNGTVSSVFDQTSFIKFYSRNHSLRGGIDFYADKRTTFGLGFNGTIDRRRNNVNSNTDLMDGYENIESRNVALTSNKDKWRNGGINLNFRRILNDKGRELTADLDYITYETKSKQQSTNTLYDLDGDVIDNPGTIVPNPYILRGEVPSLISIYSGRVDYIHPLKKNGKLEAGWKSSYVETDNNSPYEFLENGDWKPDARSNHFIYKENINALYANYSAQFKKLGIQAGLRMENTIANGHQVVKNEKFKRNYTEFFPTTYLSYAASEKSQLGLSIGRRIERPNYQDMNPFQKILDQFTYQEGNPYLRPQFSKNVELSYNYKGEWNFNLNYTSTNDIINEILRQDDAAKVTYQTKENIASSRNLGLSVSYNKQLLKWWTTSVFANGFYNKFEGRVNNADLEADLFAYMVNVNNMFRFNKGWGAEVSGFYRSKSLEGGIIVSKPMGVVNFGVSKQILKNKGSLRLNLRDPFWIQRFRGYTRFDNLDLKINNRWDNRRVAVTFSYRFGKGQQAPQRRKTGSASDEQKRVGSEGQQ